MSQGTLFTQTGRGTYYNTNGASKEEVKRMVTSITIKNQKVLEVFLNSPNELLTPYEVHTRLKGVGLITSTRRAITDLTTEGWLIKTDVKRKGQYKAENYCWQLHPKHIK